MPSVKHARVSPGRRAAKRAKHAKAARLARGNEPAVESPARLLQRDLSGALAQSRAERWSARKTTAFIVLSCGAFWAAVAYGIARLL
jgi:hypothetical protein